VQSGPIGRKEAIVTSKNLVLRTVYIDPDVDDQLRNEAFAGRTSKNDLFRKYLRLGMQAAREARQAASPAAGKRTSASVIKKTATAAKKRSGTKAAPKESAGRGEAGPSPTTSKKTRRKSAASSRDSS
jgi:hypothetical protein